MVLDVWKYLLVGERVLFLLCGFVLLVLLILDFGLGFVVDVVF